MLELKSPQERPKRRPRGPKSAKRCQDAPKSDLAAIWARFGTLRGGPNHQKPLKKQRFSRFSYFSKGAGKSSPKSSQRSPPGDENSSQERPGSGQERPKRRQDRPRSRQERPRRAPRAAQEAKKRNKNGDHLRLGSPGGPGSPLGATLERFWSVFGASGVAFWSHFRKLFSLFEAIRCDRPRERRSKRSPSSKR